MSSVKFSHGCKRAALGGSLLALACVASGCSAINRLSQIGETPKLTSIDNPTTQPGYKPVSMPMPKPETVSYNPNSLWRNGSRAFFKDQRAHQVGDILTVNGNNGLIVETRPWGVQVASRLLDSTPPPPLGAGALFGLAVKPGGHGIYYVDDVANTLRLFH